MNIVFRVDASLDMGTGHVIRCLTLADALKLKGSACLFICREHAGHLSDLIIERGHEVHLLRNDSRSITATEGALAHSAWLGADWASDAEQTENAIPKGTIDWLIVDHYAIDHRWEAALRPYCNNIMAIDDLTDRKHDCDLLLNQNFGSAAVNYQSLVPSHCTQLHGPKFALLKPVYASRRAKLKARNSAVGRAMIYFGGGSDPDNLTGRALQAFSEPPLNDVTLDIVVGGGYAHMAELAEAASRRGRANIHTHLPDLADLMASADLALGAGGATTWERCCMGLPSIVISVADNQRPACESLEKAKLIQYMGSAENMTLATIRLGVLNLISQPERLQQLSKSSLALVDGAGTERVISALNAQISRKFKPQLSQ